MDYLWSATASFSLEGVAAGELRRMGMREVNTREGRVFFTATAKEAFAANMQLRTADRVYLEVKRFKATTFDILFEGIKAIPWEKILPANAAIPVTGKCARSQLMSVRDVQSIAKKAIVERMKKAHKIDWLPENGPSFAVDVHLHADEVAVCINSSGAGLSRRGYRTYNGEAPLRETLAAAMLMLSPWREHMPLIDPMCGTGTIPIEAALIAMDKAPGLLGRTFDMESWPMLSAKDAKDVRRELAEKVHPPAAPIFASDMDAEPLELARRHAQAAGVSEYIDFACTPMEALSPAAYPPDGTIVVNPPYGERLGNRRGVEALYAALHQFKRSLSGYSLAALSSHPGFERAYGRRADKKRRLFNGRIECELYQYERAGGKR